MSVDIDKRIRLGIEPTHALYKLIHFIKERRPIYFEIELIFETEDPQDLLRQEYQMLQKEMDNPLCLNNSFESLTPKWIPIHCIEEFHNWKNNHLK